MSAQLPRATHTLSVTGVLTPPPLIFSHDLHGKRGDFDSGSTPPLGIRKIRIDQRIS